MKKVKLGEVVTLKKGKKATILNEQTILSQRYIQIDDLRNDNNLKFTESLNMTEAFLDDVLIAWDGANAGTIGYGLSGAVGSTIMVLKKNEQYKDEIISEYLGVFLESKSQYLRYHSTGATIPHLNKNILLDLKLELLRIEEQENIICILNIIKKLITKRKCQLEELNLLVKSRFNEMFGDPISNSLKLPIKKFEKVVTLQRGFDLPIQNRQVGEINVWGSNGIVATHTESKVTEQGIVTGRSGSIGKVYVTEKEYWPLNTTLFSKELHGNNPIFLKYLLEAFKLERFNNGTGVPTLNRNIVHKEDIIYVPLSLQNEFADFVAQVDKSQFACQIVIKLWRNSLKSSII